MSDAYWRMLALFVTAAVLVLAACSSDEPEVALVTPSSVAPAEPLQTTDTQPVETSPPAPVDTGDGDEPDDGDEAESTPASTTTSEAPNDTSTEADGTDAATPNPDPATESTTTTEVGPGDAQVAAFCSTTGELDALFNVDVNDSAALQASVERQQELLATVEAPAEVADDFAVVRDATDRYYATLQSTGFDYQLASNDIIEIFSDGLIEDASARLDVFEASNCVRG